MSIINEALKKAQRQRSTDSTPAPPSATPLQPLRGPIAKRTKTFELQGPVVRMAAGVLGVGVLLIAGVLYWQWKSLAPEPLLLAPPKRAAVAAAKPEGSSQTTAASPAPAPSPNAVSTPTLSAVVAAEPNVVVAKEVLPKVEPVSPTAKPRSDPRILAYIDTLRVTGIRAAGSDSKVLMNDRVFRLNDVVDHALGLKLTAVTSHSLTFEDEQGFAYTRNF